MPIPIYVRQLDYLTSQADEADEPEPTDEELGWRDDPYPECENDDAT